MEIKGNNLLAISLVGILLSSLIIPAYSEVQSVKTDGLFYTVGDEIIFSGTVDNDSSGLVTVVIRDSNDKFVLLTQALIKPDNTFERSVTVNEKFTDHGIYNATAFLVNMTEGSLTRFDLSLDGSPVSPSISNPQSKPNEPIVQTQPVTSPEPEPEPETTSKIAPFVDQSKDPQHYIDRYNNEPEYKKWFDTNYPDRTIYEAVGIDISLEETNFPKIPGFPDPEKDPQHYIDRYNNEPEYKKWFDKIFPGQSIYEIVGVSIEEVNTFPVNSTIVNPPTKETTTNMIQSSTVNSNIDSGSAEFGQMLLALGGLGILFGAVYGVKRKVDNNSVQIKENRTKLEKKVVNNSEQISQNRFWLKKKLMNLKPSDEPVFLIKARLAKGEITVEEYYKLLRALKK